MGIILHTCAWYHDSHAPLPCHHIMKQRISISIEKKESIPNEYIFLGLHTHIHIYI